MNGADLQSVWCQPEARSILSCLFLTLWQGFAFLDGVVDFFAAAAPQVVKSVNLHVFAEAKFTVGY